VCARLDVLIDTAEAWGTAGRPGWREVWRDTKGAQWRSGRDYVAAYAATWRRAL
jgi:hypothetical protein